MICTITTNSTIFSMFTTRYTKKIKNLKSTTQSQQFSNKKTTIIKKNTKLPNQIKEEKIQKLINHIMENQFIDTSNENHHEINHKTDPIDHPYAVYLYWKDQKKE